MAENLLWAAVAFSSPPLATLAVRVTMGLPIGSPRFFALWAFGGIGTAIICTPTREWPDVAGYFASGVLALILWWWSRRRRRKRALRALGHKARATLAAMVKNMPRPGPVLRPAPQSA